MTIRTLPEEFAKDADRLARFEREAELLASQDHHDIAQSNGNQRTSPEGARMHRHYLSVAILLVVTALGSACGSTPLVIQGVELDPRPSEAVPLAAQVTFETNRPATVALDFDDGDRSWTSDVGLPEGTQHVVPILGMRPDRTHRVRVVVTDRNGFTATSEVLEITTEPLPDDFPPIDVRVSVPDRMEPGVTLFEPTYNPEDGSERDYQWLIAVDEAGEVVWYYRAAHGVGDAQRLQNGNIFYRSGRTHLYEIDMLGNLVSDWNASLAPEDEVRAESIQVDRDTFHHEALETPSGNILSLSTEIRTYDAYPTSETDPNAPKATSDVVGSDVILEFTRQGQLLREIKLLDLLDPYRIGYGSPTRLVIRFWASCFAKSSCSTCWIPTGLATDRLVASGQGPTAKERILRGIGLIPTVSDWMRAGVICWYRRDIRMRW